MKAPRRTRGALPKISGNPGSLPDAQQATHQGPRTPSHAAHVRNRGGELSKPFPSGDFQLPASDAPRYWVPKDDRSLGYGGTHSEGG
jgi:hypothetical protein